MEDQDLLGEHWLAENDPGHVPARDFDHKCRAIGLQAELDYAARRGGTLVEHGARPTAKLCVRCNRPFEPRHGDQKYCADLCRANGRREYQRELMRRRRAA